jgi:hypothetical protein
MRNLTPFLVGQFGACDGGLSLPVLNLKDFWRSESSATAN